MGGIFTSKYGTGHAYIKGGVDINDVNMPRMSECTLEHEEKEWKVKWL